MQRAFDSLQCVMREIGPIKGQNIIIDVTTLMLSQNNKTYIWIFVLSPAVFENAFNLELDSHCNMGYKEQVDLICSKERPGVLLSIDSPFNPFHAAVDLGGAWVRGLCWSSGSWKTPSTQSLSVATGESCCRSAVVRPTSEGYPGEPDPVDESMHGKYSGCTVGSNETAVCAMDQIFGLVSVLLRSAPG